MLVLGALALGIGALALSTNKEIQSSNILFDKKKELSQANTTVERYRDNAREMPLDPRLFQKSGIQSTGANSGDLVRTMHKGDGPLVKKTFAESQERVVSDYIRRYNDNAKQGARYPDKKNVIIPEREFGICWVNLPNPNTKKEYVENYPWTTVNRPTSAPFYADTGLGNYTLAVDSLTGAMTGDRLKNTPWNRQSAWKKTVAMRGLENRSADFVDGLQTPMGGKKVTFLGV